MYYSNVTLLFPIVPLIVTLDPKFNSLALNSLSEMRKSASCLYSLNIVPIFLIKIYTFFLD